MSSFKDSHPLNTDPSLYQPTQNVKHDSLAENKELRPYQFDRDDDNNLIKEAKIAYDSFYKDKKKFKDQEILIREDDKFTTNSRLLEESMEPPLQEHRPLNPNQKLDINVNISQATPPMPPPHMLLENESYSSPIKKSHETPLQDDPEHQIEVRDTNIQDPFSTIDYMNNSNEGSYFTPTGDITPSHTASHTNTKIKESHPENYSRTEPKSSVPKNIKPISIQEEKNPQPDLYSALVEIPELVNNSKKSKVHSIKLFFQKRKEVPFKEEKIQNQNMENETYGFYWRLLKYSFLFLFIFTSLLYIISPILFFTQSFKRAFLVIIITLLIIIIGEEKWMFFERIKKTSFRTGKFFTKGFFISLILSFLLITNLSNVNGISEYSNGTFLSLLSRFNLSIASWISQFMTLSNFFQFQEIILYFLVIFISILYVVRYLQRKSYKE